MWDCHTTPPQRVDLALDRHLRNWWLRTRSGSSHRQIHKMAKPPWCAVPTRGVGGIVDFKVLFRRHAVKSNVTELRSHKVSWQIRPRNSSGWPASSARPTATHRRTCFGRSSYRPSVLLIPRGSPNNCHAQVDRKRWAYSPSVVLEFDSEIAGDRLLDQIWCLESKVLCRVFDAIVTSVALDDHLATDSFGSSSTLRFTYATGPDAMVGQGVEIHIWASRSCVELHYISVCITAVASSLTLLAYFLMLKIMWPGGSCDLRMSTVVPSTTVAAGLSPCPYGVLSITQSAAPSQSGSTNANRKYRRT